MRELSKQEKSILQSLISDPKWRIIEDLMELQIEKIKSNSPIRDTDSETLKETYLQEGKVRGIREFLQELYHQIS